MFRKFLISQFFFHKTRFNKYNTHNYIQAKMEKKTIKHPELVHKCLFVFYFLFFRFYFHC